MVRKDELITMRVMRAKTNPSRFMIEAIFWEIMNEMKYGMFVCAY